ncbi:MAG: hypothetical protein DWP97_03735 [Calditrichaeota bacterium]|nr:MAG: hypothetical protein DWP97_03735 [Calditrichota bacterium]
MKKITFIIFSVIICCAVVSHAQLDDLKKALGNIPGMGGTDKNATKYESVNWKPLSKLLPESIDGMESSEIEGGTFKTADPSSPSGQYSYSSVSRTYKSDAKRIKITIMDSGYNQMLMAPFMMAYEYDGPQGYMKSTEVDGHNAKEMVELKGDEVKSAQLMVAVKDRVLLMFEAKKGATMDDLKAQSSKIDYSKIESLIAETETKPVEMDKE